MRILVTGGAGFIGSNLVMELQNRYPNAEIVVVDDFTSGTFENLVNFKGEFIPGDIRQRELWEYLGNHYRFDVVFSPSGYYRYHRNRPKIDDRGKYPRLQIPP